MRAEASLLIASATDLAVTVAGWLGKCGVVARPAGSPLRGEPTPGVYGLKTVPFTPLIAMIIALT